MTSRIRWATSSGPTESDSPSTSTTNSSPPNRPTVSPSRRMLVSRLATRRRSWSPAAWPRVSLTSLKLSRSRKRADTGAFSRRSRSIICSSRSRISARFGSPVRESWKAWYSSCAVRLRMSHIARARPVPSVRMSRAMSRLIVTPPSRRMRALSLDRMLPLVIWVLVSTNQPLWRSTVLVFDPAGACPARKVTAPGPEPKRNPMAASGCPTNASSRRTRGEIWDPVHPRKSARRAATVVGWVPPE